MSDLVQTIPLANLAIAFIPVILSLLILQLWSVHPGKAIYALCRMLIQLLLIGYLLTYIFASDKLWIVLAFLLIMVFSSSWIALGTVSHKRLILYGYTFLSILLGGGLPLVLVTQGVLQLDPWYSPRFMIPLAGMIFANAMNSVSLAAERLSAETEQQVAYEQARNIALKTSLIPVLNALFAVGLVSLPGMMTGQILSGTSPLIAVRYQILVMCMIFASSCLSTACFLTLVKSIFNRRAEI